MGFDRFPLSWSAAILLLPVAAHLLGKWLETREIFEDYVHRFLEADDRTPLETPVGRAYYQVYRWYYKFQHDATFIAATLIFSFVSILVGQIEDLGNRDRWFLAGAEMAIILGVLLSFLLFLKKQWFNVAERDPLEPWRLGAWGVFAAVLISEAIVGSLYAHPEPLSREAPEWSYSGLAGTYDRAALQRGFQVYKEICAACHALKYVHFRDLAALGYNAAQVKSIAAGYQVADGPDEQGQMFERSGSPSDPIRGPFANDAAARAANGGALPPDLSLIVKARAGGPDYIYALLTGFAPPPLGFPIAAGRYYNARFPGHQIAMPPPLRDGAVKYADGTPPSLPQMARDVTVFLAWASEPTLDQRHRLGLGVILYLMVATVVFWLAKRRAWRSVETQRPGFVHQRIRSPPPRQQAVE